MTARVASCPNVPGCVTFWGTEHSGVHATPKALADAGAFPLTAPASAAHRVAHEARNGRDRGDHVRPSSAKVVRSLAWDIIEGDCIDAMRTLPAESVDALITSPPYAMQRKDTYGGVPEADYPAWTVAWMREARRVLKPDGSAVINISPHKTNGGLSDYVLRTRLALREDGWTELDEIVWHKTNAMPTGSPRRPKRTWESLLWYGKHGRAWSDAKAQGHTPAPRVSNYVTRKEDKFGWSHGPAGGRSIPTVARCTNIFASSVSGWWEKTDHPAPYPPALAAWVAHLVCPPGGTILDPFSGSASTGVAALRNGWDYIGIEAVAEYAEMSRGRLATIQTPTGATP